MKIAPSRHAAYALAASSLREFTRLAGPRLRALWDATDMFHFSKLLKATRWITPLKL
jgi:hypothetical protein